MSQFDNRLSQGARRGVLVSLVTALFLWLIFYMLRETAGLDFAQVEPLLIVIGSGWAGYWVYKKTEHGRY